MLLQTFKTVFTDSFGKKPYFINSEIGLNIFRKGNILFTGGLFTYFTIEMEVPVFMGFLIAIIIAQFVFCSGIFLYAVNDSLFLQRSLMFCKW